MKKTIIFSLLLLIAVMFIVSCGISVLYTLTITISPTGGGTVLRNPTKSEYILLEFVELTAVPANGYIFDHWEGDMTGTANPSTISMTSNKAVTAVFVQNSFPPVVTKVSGPSGIVYSNSQNFSWSGYDSDGTIVYYEYRKDSGAWQITYNTSYIWNSISEGSHTFEVRAKDNIGLYSSIVSWNFTYQVLSPTDTFKLANSWGIGGWENVPDGFLYITYQAMINNQVNCFILTPDYSYEPHCIAIFELNHPVRNECDVTVGVGDPSSPVKQKEFIDITYGDTGAYPYPDNKMVLDITELLPINGNVFLKVVNSGSSTGQIEYFSIEYYNTYALSNPDQKYTAVGLPINIPTYGNNSISIPGVSLAPAFTNQKEAISNLITEDFDPADFEYDQGGNVVIDGHGTGWLGFRENDIPWLEKNVKKIVGLKEYTMLPDSADNSDSQYFPPIGNQGNVGSCVAWSFGYYTNTYYNAIKHGWDLSSATWIGGYYGNPSPAYQDRIMSPNFVYNQINSGLDDGAYYVDAIDFISSIGESSWEKFPYETNPENGTMNYCTDWPGEQAYREAPLYRNDKGTLYYVQVTDLSDIATLKSLVDSGYLVSVSIDANQYSHMTSNDVWNAATYHVVSTNHANTIVGYSN